VRISPLKVEGFSKRLITICQTILNYIPTDPNLNTECCESLWPHTQFWYLGTESVFSVRGNEHACLLSRYATHELRGYWTRCGSASGTETVYDGGTLLCRYHGNNIVHCLVLLSLLAHTFA
jgi:hypothetical protein